MCSRWIGILLITCGAVRTPLRAESNVHTQHSYRDARDAVRLLVLWPLNTPET
jgi:hypothetical protein